MLFFRQKKYDRAICLMYDLSGMEAGEEDILICDWKELCEKYKLVSRTTIIMFIIMVNR